jgi:hypothetical protein
MSESDTVVRAKYTTVNIPVKLFLRIEKLISQNQDFKTVTDYVTFVLREVVMARAASGTEECFNSEDLAQLKSRLEALGAM